MAAAAVAVGCDGAGGRTQVVCDGPPATRPVPLMFGAGCVGDHPGVADVPLTVHIIQSIIYNV